VAGLGILALCGAAQATPLGLVSGAKPDITSDFIDVEYDAGSDLFSALGFAEQLVDLALVTHPNTAVTYGSFSITATIDAGGNASAGSLSITGAMPSLGAPGPTLLTGTLSAFGFLDPPGGDIFEFLFTITGGDLATPGQYGLPGSTVGVILTMFAPGSFNGTFTNSFNNNGGIPGFGAGVSDTFFIPEPNSLVLLSLGVFICLRRKP